MNPEHFTAVQNLLKQGWSTQHNQKYYALSCDEKNERQPQDVKHLLLTNPTIGNTKSGHKVKGHKIMYRPEFDIFYRLRFDEYLSEIDRNEANALYELSQIKKKGRAELDKTDKQLGVAFAGFCIWWNLSTSCIHLYETHDEKYRRLANKGKIVITMTNNGGGWEKGNKYRSSHRSGYEKDHHRKFIQDPHKKQ
tara:strand:- start:945 stop:1526 length:582 start_codon:yes stop_codon:yes gene_type:complete